jgi:anti-sigma factor RsiW
MNDCRSCKDRMIEALYGELGPADRERFDRHICTCPECASEYSLLGATLRLMDKRERPDPGPEFWDGYWDRLSRGRGRPSPPASSESSRIFPSGPIRPPERRLSFSSAS